MNVEKFNKYQVQPAWYCHEPYGIHGLSHAARVFVWANRIGQWLLAAGKTVDLEAVRWGAVLHDIRRQNDGWDSNHGSRAANWVAENRNSLPIAFSKGIQFKVAYACTWHDADDDQIPEWIPELICLKDADGLDRVRIADLDPTFLRTPCARGFANQAQELYDLTGFNESVRWVDVFTQAGKMGLLD